jgi:hypothetical protein
MRREPAFVRYPRTPPRQGKGGRSVWALRLNALRTFRAVPAPPTPSGFPLTGAALTLRPSALSRAASGKPAGGPDGPERGEDWMRSLQCGGVLVVSNLNEILLCNGIRRRMPRTYLDRPFTRI